MGQRQADREWPRPRTTRHVWIVGLGPGVAPVQGFVVAWHRQSRHWSALVVYVEPIGDVEQLVQRWMPADRLRPVRTEPNETLR